jgi:hypothetical protein
VRPHRLIFGDVVKGVFSLNPAIRKLNFVANLGDFSISPDGRWLVGFALPLSLSEKIGLISLTTGRCVLVPGGQGIDKFSVSHLGFSPSGNDVVTAKGHVASRYPIRSLRSRCPTWMTTQNS